MPRKSPSVSTTRGKLRLGARSIGLFRQSLEDTPLFQQAESVELALSTIAAEL